MIAGLFRAQLRQNLDEVGAHLAEDFQLRFQVIGLPIVGRLELPQCASRKPRHPREGAAAETDRGLLTAESTGGLSMVTVSRRTGFHVQLSVKPAALSC